MIELLTTEWNDVVTPDALLALLAALGAIATVLSGKKTTASPTQTITPNIVIMLQETITAMESSNKNLREENDALKVDKIELTRENDQLKAELRRAYTRLDRLEMEKG